MTKTNRFIIIFTAAASFAAFYMQPERRNNNAGDSCLDAHDITLHGQTVVDLGSTVTEAARETRPVRQGSISGEEIGLDILIGREVRKEIFKPAQELSITILSQHRRWGR